MKKAAVLLTSLLLLAGCKKAMAPTTESTSVEPTAQTSDFAAALQSGQPVSCSLVKKDGSSTMNYMMKGKKFKVTGVAATGKEGSTNVISDGEFMYTWGDAGKTGMKIALSKQDTNNSTPTQPTIQSEADKKKYEDQGYDVNCAVATVDDSEFIPPTDITFTDTGAMMPKSIPSINPQNQEEMQQKAQEMMKQYQGQ